METNCHSPSRAKLVIAQLRQKRVGEGKCKHKYHEIMFTLPLKLSQRTVLFSLHHKNSIPQMIKIITLQNTT